MYILSHVFLLVDNCIFLASMNKVPTLLFICGRFFSFVDPMLTHKSRNPCLPHFSYLQHYNKKAFQWDAYRPLLWFGGRGKVYPGYPTPWIPYPLGYPTPWIRSPQRGAFCIPQFPFAFEFECERPNCHSAIHKSFELPFS